MARGHCPGVFNYWAVMRVLDDGSIKNTVWLLNSKSCIAYSSTSPVTGPWLLPSVRYTKSWSLSEWKLTLWCQPENVILDGLVRTLSSVVHFHIGLGSSLPCQIPREVLWMCPPCSCIGEDGSCRKFQSFQTYSVGDVLVYDGHFCDSMSYSLHQYNMGTSYSGRTPRKNALGVCRDQYHILIYHKTSNIRRTLVGNNIVDHSDVVGASPVGAAPTTSSFST